MDAQTGIAVGGLVLSAGCSIVAIAVYTSRTRAMTEANGKEIDSVAHKTRNLDNWRLTVLPNELNANFARKDTVASELKAIHDSLARIEKHQEMMALRFMNGGIGA